MSRPYVGGYTDAVKFPADVRASIERAVRPAIENREHRSVAIREFIADLEYHASLFVSLRRRWPKGRMGRQFRSPHDEPTKTDITAPIANLEKAMTAFNAALDQLPTEWASTFDALLRYRTLAASLDRDTIEQRHDQLWERVCAVHDGGDIDVYLPETESSMGMETMLRHLSAAIGDIKSGAASLPTGRPEDGSKRALVQSMGEAYQRHIGARTINHESQCTPFQRVMQAVFLYLSQHHGVTGVSHSNLTKAVEPRRPNKRPKKSP